MIMGPLVSRFGRSYVITPGGDKIGRRPLDTHFLALEKLGAIIKSQKKNIFKIEKEVNRKRNFIRGSLCYCTANIIMAASLANGITKIYNAACEPYIQQLCKMLNKYMGPKSLSRH